MSDSKEVFSRLAPNWWDPSGQERREERSQLLSLQLDLVTQIVSDFVQRNNSVNSSDKVLDVGCGQGRYTKVLEDFGFRTFGLDISDQMLAKAKETTQNTNFVNSDCLSLPFPENTFSIVVAMGLSHHVCDLEKLLQELERITVNRGLIIFNISNKNSLATRWSRISQYNKNVSYPVHQYSPTEIKKMIDDIGFTIDKSVGIGSIYPLSLFPYWKGIIINGNQALTASKRLDPLIGNRFGHDLIFACTKG